MAGDDRRPYDAIRLPGPSVVSNIQFNGARPSSDYIVLSL
jgi:hypothetical protein